MSDQEPSDPVPTGRLRRYTVEQARELFRNMLETDDSDSSEEEYVDRDRSSSEEERVELENRSSRRGALPKRGKANKTGVVAEEQGEWSRIGVSTEETRTRQEFQPVHNTQSEFELLTPGRRPQGVDPASGITPESKASDCFRALWTDQIHQNLCQAINSYAEKRVQMNNPAKKHSVFAKWEPVTVYELLKLLILIIAMGLNPLPAMRKYWSKKEVYNSPLFRKLFSKDRFEAIFSSMLHVGNKDSEGKEKIEPFLNDLVTNFNKVYYPFQNLSLNEMVIGFTGRWQFKQYNASKPKEYHIKSFGLVDATTGYILNILVYFGSGTSYDPAADDGSMAVKVFQTLLQNVGSGHHIYADRYYTTRKLVDYLLSRQTYYTRTLNLNRVGFPQELKTAKLEHLESRTYRNEDKTIQVTAWRDKKAKKPVVIVSTNADSSYVRRKNKIKPKGVDSYNQSMNGCDLADQMITYYASFNRKTYKWWKKLFFFWSLELCQYNAFVLFKLSRPEQNKSIAFLDFKKDLIDELLVIAAKLMPEELRDAPLTVEVDPALKIPLKDCWGTDTSFTGQAWTGIVCFAALPKRENAQHLFAKDVLTSPTFVPNTVLRDITL